MDQWILPAVGLGVIGYFVFKAMKNTKEADAIQNEGSSSGPPGAIMQYEELSNINLSPYHTQIRKDYTPVIRTEAGPYGVPRTVHKTPGGWIIEGLDYFNKFY